MNRSIIFFLGILLILFGCQTDKTDHNFRKGKVTISGKINNVDSRVVSIEFEDIIRGQAHYSQIIDTINGIFQFVFDIYHSQDIRFSYQNKHLQLFVEPFDSLFITFDKNEFNANNRMIENVSFSGTNERINKEIADFNLFSSIPEFDPDCNGKSVKLYLNDLEQQISIEFNELELFIKKKNPSSKFIQWANKNIIYSNANYLIDYTTHLKMNKLPQNDSLFHSGLFPVNDESSLISSMFGVHLSHYVFNIHFYNDIFISENNKNKNYLQAYKRSIENVIKNEPKGLIRDLMIYQLLSSLFDQSVDDFKTLWQQDNKYINNQLLISVLNDRLLQALNESSYGITYLENLLEGDSQFTGDIFNQLLEQSKNKVCFINIWATWCGPCRTAIPYLAVVHEKFKNDIEFISICNGADRDTWRLVINENNIPGQHYYLDKEQTIIFRSKLNFSGYPTYMIIKDGKIINKNSPSPISLEINEELLRIIAM